MSEPIPTVARYAYAALCVTVALVAAMALASFELEGFVFVIAVAVAVWMSGRGPGVLAVGLSVLALHFVFIAPRHAGALPHTAGYVVVFSVLALLITSLVEGRHRAERLLVTARDDFEAKVAERTEDLQRKQELLDLAQRSARAMAFDWYLDREVNAWSPEQEALYGLGPGAFDGRYASWRKLIHPADWPVVVAAMQRARADGEIFAEFRVIWPDGSIHWLAANGRLFLDAGGKPYRMVGFTTDVTARKLEDEQRRRHEAYLSAGERVSHTGSWAVEGATRRVLHSSDEHRRLFGFDPRAGVPSREAYFERVHPDDRSVCAEAIGTVADRKVRREWQYRVNLPDRTSKHFAAVAHPVLDAEGNVVEIIGTTMDVTERKRAEEALRDSEHRLRKAQAELAHVTRVTTLGEVTASLAHELNQPLAAIMNNASACLAVLSVERPDVEELRAGLQDIVDDTERARVIMERVRGLAKRSATETGPIALADVVADVIALAATESAARSVTIRTDVAPDVPVVIGDRVQLQQVLLNLVVNGMDAMRTAPDAARSLEIRVQRDQHGSVPSARVAVCDRGIGLDGVEPDRLFEAFYTTKPQGMGMGLAISRSIIEAHGGRLWAEANDGPGATFSFSIPVAS